MIHQKKGNSFLCLVVDVILRMDIKLTTTFFFHFYVSNVHILVNNEYENLKLCIHVANIHGGGTVSTIFDFGPSFYFM